MALLSGGAPAFTGTSTASAVVHLQTAIAVALPQHSRNNPGLVHLRTQHSSSLFWLGAFAQMQAT